MMKEEWRMEKQIYAGVADFDDKMENQMVRPMADSVNLGAFEWPLGKAAEGRRSPRRSAYTETAAVREASWTAPVLWRFV
jgi:hypothetical protein